MRDKNIVAILGVGNKPTEYTEKDIEIISYLADVAWEIAERKKAEEERNQYSLNLRERMKELNCLYSISEIVRRENISQEEILKLCPDIISQAYQFPEITACRIVWGDHENKTDNFRETHWSQVLTLWSMVCGGSIEVCSIGGKHQECYDDCFLAAERNLLQNITDFWAGLPNANGRKKNWQSRGNGFLIYLRAQTLAHGNGMFRQVKPYSTSDGQRSSAIRLKNFLRFLLPPGKSLLIPTI
jgi:hypothetical protein